jgi:hypothetical protein
LIKPIIVQKGIEDESWWAVSLNKYEYTNKGARTCVLAAPPTGVCEG